MKKIRLVSLALLLGATSGSAPGAPAFDPCATFFWTSQHHEPVERYKPRYLLGLGLEDVGMGHIIGSRIRTKWSQQAAGCLASVNRYGYFFHPDFERHPNGNFKRLSEKLADVLAVVQYLGQSTTDPIYRDSLRRAKTESYVVIHAMENAVTSMAGFYGGLVAEYDSVIERLARIINIALPTSVRTALLDELCSPDNVARLQELVDDCWNGDHCELAMLYETINHCSEHQDGAELEEQLAALTQNHADLQDQRADLEGERTEIVGLWSAIEALE